MTPTDRPVFITLIQALAASFRIEASEALFEAYWLAADDISLENLTQGVRRAIRDCERMPSGKELRELCGETKDRDRAMLAFAAVDKAVSTVGVYRSPDFDDPTTNAAVRHLGGWEFICSKTEAEFNKWFRKEFVEVYEMLIRRGVGDDEAAPLVGIYERTNRMNGHERNTRVPVITGLSQKTKPRIAERKQERIEAKS